MEGLSRGSRGPGGHPQPTLTPPRVSLSLDYFPPSEAHPDHEVPTGAGVGWGAPPGRIKGPRASDFFPEDPGPQVPFILQAQEPWTPGPSSLTDPHLSPPAPPSSAPSSRFADWSPGPSLPQHSRSGRSCHSSPSWRCQRPPGPG